MIKNRHGKQALHVAAAYNRKDVVEWLVCEMCVDPNSVDEDGKNAQQLAKASGSDDVQHFLRKHQALKVVARFTQKSFRMRKQRAAFGRAVSAARAIQSKYRSWRVFRTTCSDVHGRIVQRQGFMSVWGPLVKLLGIAAQDSPLCWVSMKNSSFDFSRVFEEDEGDETRQVVLDATESAARGTAFADSFAEAEVEDDEDDRDAVPLEDVDCNGRGDERSTKAWELESIKLTAEALKWYKHADPRLSMLFLRRLEQLAAGDRSRILNKVRCKIVMIGATAAGLDDECSC